MEYRLDDPHAASRLMNRLRLKHWALLAALSDMPVLAQAASAVSVMQPSSTKMLEDIEVAFNFQFFERLSRGLRPTPLGEESVAFARQSQAGLARFLAGLEIKRRGGHGQLVIGAIMSAAPDLVPRAAAEPKPE